MGSECSVVCEDIPALAFYRNRIKWPARNQNVKEYKNNTTKWQDNHFYRLEVAYILKHGTNSPIMNTLYPKHIDTHLFLQFSFFASELNLY